MQIPAPVVGAGAGSRLRLWELPVGQRLAVHHLAGEDLGGRDGEIAVPAVHGEGVAAFHLAGDDLPADEGLHRMLEVAAQGPGAVDGGRRRSR